MASGIPLKGAELRRLRKAHELTQEKLAETLGISLNHINAVENSRKNASLGLALQYCEYFNVELSTIMNFEKKDDTEIRNKLLSDISKDCAQLDTSDLTKVKLIIRALKGD